jgi:phytanoyl-CoA hydroxylase
MLQEPRFAAPVDGRLSPEMIAAYRATGFLVLEGYRSAAACDALNAAIDRLVDGFDPASVQTVFSADDQRHAADTYFRESGDQIRFFFEKGAFDAEGHLVKDKHRALNKIGHAMHDRDAAFDAFSRGPDLARTAADLGMADPAIMQSMVIFKQPFIGGEVGMHQDSTFLHTTPTSVIGFWFALEDADETNGCLIGLAGVHDQPLKERFHYEGDRLVMTALDGAPFAGGVELPLRAPKGTLVVLHGQAPHRSAPNTSPRSRRAYTLHAVDRATRWSPDNWLIRDPTLPLRGFA